MKEFKENYEPILRDALFRFPFLSDKMIDWYPHGKFEVTIKDEDGKLYIYNSVTHTMRNVPPREKIGEYENEEEWREEFRSNLRRKLAITNLTQEQLSEVTGISKTTISNYMQGRATPSGYNILKMAKALGCSIKELYESY